MHRNFIALDTETTGLTANAYVIELAALWFVNGKVQDVFDSRFDPIGIDWDAPTVKQAEAVHKIPKEDLVCCPTFESHVEPLLEFLGRAPVLVMHNAKFDYRMLTQEFARAGFSTFRREYSELVCTLMLDRLLSPAPHKLADSCNRWGVQLVNAHSAYDDAKACGELLLAMHKSGRVHYLKDSGAYVK